MPKSVMQKKKTNESDATNLWDQRLESVNAVDFVKDIADTEKMLIFSETGGGKTTFYLNILKYLKDIGFDKNKLMMTIVLPDRPTGFTKLFSLIPPSYRRFLHIFTVNNYEDTIKATATSEEMLIDHYEKTGTYGWMVFELLENYWSFSQDFYSRQAYGTSMGDYFAHMRNAIGQSDKQAAYEAFAGPYGGPWPIIKFFHNFNWIDRIKRMPFNTVFTSEVKEETNKDSIFFSLGLRPAGEKNNMHRVDTILYLSHKQNDFYMRPFKLTGYKKLYPQMKITNKNGYRKHKEALKRLEELGYKTTKIEDIEQAAGIKPPDISKKEEKKKETLNEKEIEIESSWDI